MHLFPTILNYITAEIREKDKIHLKTSHAVVSHQIESVHLSIGIGDVRSSADDLKL